MILVLLSLNEVVVIIVVLLGNYIERNQGKKTFEFSFKGFMSTVPLVEKKPEFEEGFKYNPFPILFLKESHGSYMFIQFISE